MQELNDIYAAYEKIESVESFQMNIVKIMNRLGEDPMSIQVDVIYFDAIIAEIYIQV